MCVCVCVTLCGICVRGVGLFEVFSVVCGVVVCGSTCLSIELQLYKYISGYRCVIV